MRLKAVWGLLISLALLVALITQIQWPQVAASMAQVPVWVWLITGLGACASFGLRAARMQREWRHIQGATWPACLHLFLWHNAAVAWLPLRSGEGVYWWWLVRRWQVSHSQALSSLLWLRMQDGVVLLWLTATAMAPLWVPSVWPWQPAALMLLPLLVGCGLFCALPVVWERVQARWLQQGDHGAAVELAPSLLRGVWAALLASRGGRWAWVLCAANWLLKLMVVALLLQALAPLGALDALHGALGGEWAALLPLNGPGGLGPYEAGVWLGIHADAWLYRADQLPGLQLGDLVAAALVAHVFWLLVASVAAVLVHLWHHVASKRDSLCSRVD